MPRPQPRRFPARAVLALAVFAACSLAGAETPAASPYAPYAFLIGRWDVAPETGGPPIGGALLPGSDRLVMTRRKAPG